jgi:hypothetical protein
MADRLYAGTPADFAIGLGALTALLDEAGVPIGELEGWQVLIPQLPAEFDVYDANENAYTDLVDAGGNSVSTISSSDVWETAGQILLFTVNDAPDGDVYLVSSGGTPFEDPTFRLSPATDEIFTRLAAVEAMPLAGLSNVSDTPATNGQVLRFNTGTGQWEPASGIAPVNLDDLGDVNVGTATTGQALVRQANGTWAAGSISSGGATIHSQLQGLSADDHTQYFNVTRGDARYYTKTQVDALATAASTAQSANDRARANHTGTQPISTVDGLSGELASKALPGQTAGGGGKFYGLYADFASLPAAGNGQQIGDFALYIVED